MNLFVFCVRFFLFINSFHSFFLWFFFNCKDVRIFASFRLLLHDVGSVLPSESTLCAFKHRTRHGTETWGSTCSYSSLSWFKERNVSLEIWDLDKMEMLYFRYLLDTLVCCGCLLFSSSQDGMSWIDSSIELGECYSYQVRLFPAREWCRVGKVEKWWEVDFFIERMPRRQVDHEVILWAAYLVTGPSRAAGQTPQREKFLYQAKQLS